MGVIFFAFFTVMEIALTVLSFTKYRSLWHRNRVLFSGAELILLLLVILLPMTGQKWRFTGCVIILGIRLVVSGITYLIKRRGSAKEKTNAKVIAGAVMSIIIISFSLLPAFIFTGYTGLKTTGQYKVRETQAILIDKSRLEAHENDGSNREIPIHFYYGADDNRMCDHWNYVFLYHNKNWKLYVRGNHAWSCECYR